MKIIFLPMWLLLLKLRAHSASSRSLLDCVPLPNKTFENKINKLNKVPVCAARVIMMFLPSLTGSRCGHLFSRPQLWATFWWFFGSYNIWRMKRLFLKSGARQDQAFVRLFREQVKDIYHFHPRHASRRGTEKCCLSHVLTNRKRDRKDFVNEWFIK